MFDLPDPSRYQLVMPPLRQALAQVRFPLLARFQTLEGVAAIQDQLRDRFPYMERQDTAEMGVVFGPGGLNQPEVGTTTTWELTNDEGTLLSIGPGIATLSVGSEYRDVDWFSEQFNTMLVALAESGDVRRCDRVGVRYLDVIDAQPGEPRVWTTWFRPEVVGWAATEILDDSATLMTSLNQMAITAESTDALAKFPGDVQAAIRNGLVQANSVVPGIPPIRLDQEAFILDMDVFVAAPQPFSASTIFEQFRALHREIDRFFRWALTSTGEERFQLTEEVS